MLISLFILLACSALVLWRARLTQDGQFFFSKDYTTVLKGLCSIVVVFVHIPLDKGNSIQDAVGSFGYICVTLFFMFSAYGLSWSMNSKRGYLNNFLKNRVVVLLMPFTIVALLKWILGINIGSGGTYFVFVLTIFYSVFYLAKKFIAPKYQDVLICGFVIAYSLTGQILGKNSVIAEIGLGWYCESLGFMYGIILFNLQKQYKKTTGSGILVKSAILTIASGLLGVLYIKYKYINFSGSYLLRIVLGISLILLLFTVTSRIKLGNKPAIFLGNISYEVFLLHGLVLNILSKAAIIKSSGLYILAVIVLTIVLATGLNYIDNQLIKRISGARKNPLFTNQGYIENKV